MKKISFALILTIFLIGNVLAVGGAIGNSATTLNGNVGEVIPGNLVLRNVNNVPVEVNLSLDNDGSKFITLKNKSVILLPNEDKTIIFETFSNIPGTNKGKINILFSDINGNSASSTLTVTITLNTVFKKKEQRVAYVVKNSADGEITNSLKRVGANYTIIKETDLSSANFSAYSTLIVGDGVFSNPNLIPVTTKNSLVLNTFHVSDWKIANSISSISETQRSNGIFVFMNEINKNIAQPVELYTQAKKPIYYLPQPAFRAVGLKTVVARNDSDLKPYVGVIHTGGKLMGNANAKGRILYWGLSETSFWTQDTRTMFDRSITWVLNGEDFDGDGYDRTAVGGNDCDDNNPLINPGSSDSTKNCIDEKPILKKQIPNLNWNEDTEFTINLSEYFSEPDGETLIYGISGTSNNKGINVVLSNTGIVKFIPQKDFNGKDWIIFNASDGKNSINSNNVTLTVKPVNDAPVLNEIGKQFTFPGGLVKLSPSATDIDGDNLTFTFSTPFNSSGFWQTEKNSSGIFNSSVSVSDGNNGVDTKKFQVEILSKILINEISSDNSNGKNWFEIYNPANQQIDLSNCYVKNSNSKLLNLNGIIKNKEFVSFDFEFSANGDKIDLYCYNLLIDFVSYGDFDDGNLNDNALVPEKDKSIGRNPDGKDTDKDNEDFVLYELPTRNLKNNADLIPPVVELISPLNGAFFNDTRDIPFNFSATDNSNKLDCSLFGNFKGTFKLFETMKLENLTIGEFIVKGLKDGIYLWNIECSDQDNKVFAAENRTFSISAPDNPVIKTIGDKTVSEGKLIEFEISATDADGDSIVFSVEDLPIEANFKDNNNGTAKFSWTPNYTQSGNYNIKFIATDNSDERLTGTKVVKINVKDAKAPPTFSDVETCKIITPELNIEIKDPDRGDDFKPGEKVKVKVSVKNNADKNLNVDGKATIYNLKKEKDEDNDKDRVKVDRGKKKDLEFNLEIPDDIEEEDLAVFVIVKDNDGNYCNSAFVDINVERDDDDVRINSFKVSPETISPGENLRVDVKVKNVGNDEQEVIVKLEIPGLSISKESEGFNLEEFDEDDTETKSFDIEIPRNAKEGTYEVITTVSFGSDSNSETKTINVIGSSVSFSLPQTNSIVASSGGIIKLNGQNNELSGNYYTQNSKIVLGKTGTQTTKAISTINSKVSELDEEKTKLNIVFSDGKKDVISKIRTNDFERTNTENVLIYDVNGSIINGVLWTLIALLIIGILVVFVFVVKYSRR